MIRTNFITQSINSALLIKRMLLGAVIGFILIAAFLLSAGEGKLEWGNYWLIKPILMVPFADSIGGAFSYLTTLHLRHGGYDNCQCIKCSRIHLRRMDR
jgi:hypothetical protein